jgi:hypothetical protein
VEMLVVRIFVKLSLLFAEGNVVRSVAFSGLRAYTTEQYANLLGVPMAGVLPAAGSFL